ncbi:S9 family peptidase [Oceanobacillus saliphilus]|uniref:S9 family peptidase n=1 Tax=Oceanobacillus saliphilus TaxID=2925834 RepID=UPI00201DCFFD|nr:S9 family peptidase [Oceanobacillus saliphilus]
MVGLSIDPYLHVRTVKSFEYGRNGNNISFISDYTGVPQVWEVRPEDGWPYQVSFAQEGVTFFSYVPGTSDRIIGMDNDGDERVQLYLLKTTGELVALTNSPEHVHMYGGSSPDGKWIAWSSNRRNPAFFDIYLQNLNTLKIHLVFAQNDIFSVVRWFPDGKALLVRKTHSPLYHDLGTLSLLTGEMEWITEHEVQAGYKNIHFNKDGDHIYLLSNKHREFFGIAFIHIETKDFTWLECGAWDFENLTMNKEKNKLAFTINEGGISKGRILDLNRSKIDSWESPMGVIANLRFSPDNKKLTYVLNGSAHPSDIWEVDLETLQAKRLTYVSRTPILHQRLFEPTIISYPSFDELSIPAFYYKPTLKNVKFPVLVYMHGGPESQSRPVYNPLLQYLLNIGYVVIAPNIRGSTGYGKTYTHLDDVRKRMDAVKDLVYLVKWLESDSNVDVDKIAIMGGSYGGFIVLAALTHYPKLWAAGVDIVGISSLRTFLATTSPWRRKLREAEYGTIEKDGEFFDKIDPLHYADNIKAPLMVLHGANDPRVPIEESEQIVNKLIQRNHPVIYLRFEDEGHSIIKLKNKLIAYTKIAEFLK